MKVEKAWEEFNQVLNDMLLSHPERDKSITDFAEGIKAVGYKKAWAIQKATMVLKHKIAGEVATEQDIKKFNTLHRKGK